MKKYAPPLNALIGIADLQAVADLSSNVVQKVRAAMLAPTASKTPPVFSTSELSDLCGIEKSHVLYHAKKGTLLPSVKNGARLECTLEEAKQLLAKNKNVYASVAPSWAGVLGWPISRCSTSPPAAARSLAARITSITMKGATVPRADAAQFVPCPLNCALPSPQFSWLVSG